MDAHDKILNILIEKDEITWKSIIYELVKSEEMDPWDVDISILTKRYIEMIKKLKELDFRISGKVLLAAVLLLKMKCDKLLNEDISQFDILFIQPEEPEELFEEFEEDRTIEEEKPKLLPRVPQPRKRKVSIYDLVKALERALEVKKRRLIRSMPITEVEVPTKKREITELIKELYSKIKNYFLQNSRKRLTFSQLVPSEKREDKIYTFIPLLHLTTLRKIDLEQYQHFGEIEIILRTKQEIEKELSDVGNLT